MGNVLIGKTYAIDRLYRVDAAAAFAGKSVNLGWNSRRQGMVLVPPAVGAAARSAIIRGKFTSTPVQAELPFHEVLPSWNIELDEKAQGYRIALRVAGQNDKWSPWFYLGSGGIAVERVARKTTQSAAWGEVHTDFLVLRKAATQFQYRVELESTREASAVPAQRATLRRFFVSYSNTSEDPELYREFKSASLPELPRREINIPIPYRSQRDVAVKKLRNQICCPTCVSMILAANGIEKPTLQVAAEALCRETDTYGVWPRASQIAAMNGMDAWVQRLRTHAEVKSMLASGQPVMASIRVNKGDWAHKTYTQSKGHLILLRGIRMNGDYIVNDPFATGPTGAEIDYSEKDMEKVWLEKGGVAIIIRKPVQP